jgi:hypothetical protein
VFEVHRHGLATTGGSVLPGPAVKGVLCSGAPLLSAFPSPDPHPSFPLGTHHPRPLYHSLHPIPISASLYVPAHHPTPTPKHRILTPFEAEAYVEQLKIFSIKDIGNPNWLQQHQFIEKLNVQTHVNVQNETDEFVMEHLISHEKIPVYVSLPSFYVLVCHLTTFR